VTSGEAASTEASAAEEAQQVPIVINIPAAVEARDNLLQAIAREAQHVANRGTGQASTVLVELARAYALVTTGATEAGEVPPPVLVPQAQVSSRAEWGID
jgi:hypothetical protein